MSMPKPAPSNHNHDRLLDSPWCGANPPIHQSTPIHTNPGTSGSTPRTGATGRASSAPSTCWQCRLWRSSPPSASRCRP
jgi:hypothetical protein